MDLVAVTVSYNTRDLLGECLDTLFAGLERSGVSAQVWVVDNGSTDGSADMVRQRFPDVHLIAQDENLGFAAANNLALRRVALEGKAAPRHILFLNPDTRVVGDALGALVRFLDGTPQAGVAGARLVYDDGRFQHSAFAFPGLVHAVDHPLGAAFLVRREVWAQVGGFDERFFMYCEEIDLCRRIKGAGWGIYCVPRAEIVHLAGQSTRQFRAPMFVALWRSRFLMYEKHEGPLFRWLARRIVRLGLAAEARRARAAFKRGDSLAAYREVARL